MKKVSRGYYARILGTFWRHPRTCGLSMSARGLWVSLLSWCADQMSDGALTDGAMLLVASGAPMKRERAELHAAGLLMPIEAGSGWLLRDWSQHNITREEYEREKERARTGMAVTRNKAPTVTRNKVVKCVSPSDQDQDLSERERAAPRPAPQGPESAGASLTSRAETVRSRLEAAYKSRGIRPPARDLSVPHSRAVLDVTRTLSDDGKLSEVDLDRLIAGFFKSERARSAGYPIAFLATNPAEYLAPAPNSPAAALPWDLHDIERLALSAAGEGRQWAATSKLERAWQGLLERHPALMAGRKHPGHLAPKEAAA